MSIPHWIGQPSPRPDAPAKAAGQALYIHDVERPGMLYGKIKTSDVAHARIVDVDTTRAERLPGVRAVITAENTPELRFGRLGDNVALKGEKVRRYFDEVAAVAAVDPETAAEAVELIEVEYEPLPAVFDPEEALAEDAPLLHPESAPSSNLLPLTFHHLSGDVEAARVASAHVAEGTFTTPRIHHCALGTPGCVAEIDLHGNLTMWTRTQVPFLARRDFNRALRAIGLGGRNSRVLVPAVGGAFGSGLETLPYEYIAILLAHRSGRPVKVLFDRREEFNSLPTRQGTRIHVRQGCDADGRLTFREVDVLQDAGAYSTLSAMVPGGMMVPATSLYRVPAVRFDARVVYTNNTTCLPMRGFGNPEATWAIESNLDDLAALAGVDPLEMRRLNCNEASSTTPMGLEVTSCGLRPCLDGAARKVGWRRKRGENPAQDGPRRRGVGLAAVVHPGGSRRAHRSDGCGILLRLDDDGNVYVTLGAVEMGQGLVSALTLGIAEQLGVLPEDVFVNDTDTATCPWDLGTHASRGAFTALNASAIATEQLRRRIFELAVDVFPGAVAENLARYQERNPGYEPPEFDFTTVTAENLDLRDGDLFMPEAPDEPWARLELSHLLSAVHLRQGGEMLAAEAFYDPPTELPDWENGHGNLSAAYAFGTQAVEVEVDEETGDVEILRLAAVHDVGTVLNPTTLEGQVYGAIAQGIGQALIEEVRTEEGRIVNANLADYKVPRVDDTSFPIHLEFVETEDEAGPFGAKGAGEIGLVATAPAIANAIYHAVGVRVRDLPITPEKVLAGLRERTPEKA